MKAILVRASGGAEQLVLAEAPTPVPGEREILVRVQATSLNRADILQRQGKYPPPPGTTEILGLDMAGVVEKGTGRWKKGDRVFGLLAGGGYAEYCTIHEDLATPVPDNLSFEEAAAIPEAYLTAYQCLFWHGELKAGHEVLIHAAASGVGMAAIQLVTTAGARAHATVRSGHKLEACRKMGAAMTVDTSREPFAQKILGTTNGHGADIILDFVGAPFWEQNLDGLAMDGRWILISTLGGGVAEKADLRTLMKKRARIIATNLRPRPLDYKIRLTREFSDFALPRIASGTLKPAIDSITPWTQVAEAHRRMEENRNIGKIVLTVP